MNDKSLNFTSLPNSSITYAEAIRLGIGKQMSLDKSVLVYGLGVDDPKAMYGTLQDFPSIFGADRCFDTPLSEDSLTGYGIGLGVAGFKPIHVHQRTDFLLLCCNQLINMAAKIKYLSNGFNNCPFVVRAITGRSWGQGSQHSQSFHSLFANIPGLRVLTPSTPQDAYNVYSNIFNDYVPTIVIEHRMLYGVESKIKTSKSLPKVTKLDDGNDITICSISHMTLESQKAINTIKEFNIYSDHFSIVDHSNLELDSIIKSANKTNKIIIIDHGWLNSSIGSTIVQKLYQYGFKGEFRLLGYANSPCPTARSLENQFYPSAASILKEILELLGHPLASSSSLPVSKELIDFKGPF
tara:strand:- start:7230 stop:8288 length:1059 start_codon:yes stop_codon:yes gene_type:complete